MASTRNGLNIRGVGVMCEHFTKGRWIHAITEGAGGAGLHMFSVYGYDTGTPEHARLNMELDQGVFGAVAALDGAPWIIGGDWNRKPEMIAESGAVEPIGGFIG
eukprot:13755953-Heterocapsa_arctica.AAC.1